MVETNQKITMNVLFKRNNRNRHFQIVNENGWLGKNHVYTGLGLYKSIMECSRLNLVGKYPKEFRDDPKNAEFLLEKQLEFQKEMCKDVIMGKNKDARKNDLGQVLVEAAWELD